MPRDRFTLSSRRLVLALCLGVAANGQGCSPESKGDASRTPDRLKAIKKNGQAVIPNQGSRPPSRPSTSQPLPR